MVEWWNFPVLECVELFVDFGNLGIPRYHSLFFFFRFQLRGQGEHLRGCNCIAGEVLKADPSCFARFR